MLNLFSNFPNLVKLFLTFLAVAFIAILFFVILKSRQPAYPAYETDFRVGVEVETTYLSFTNNWHNLEKSFSYSSRYVSRSFSCSFKPLKDYFYLEVEVDDKSIVNFIKTYQPRDLLLTFSLAAKRDLKGKIFAYFYEANGSLIKRDYSSDNLGSTHLLSQHYPSFLSASNPENSSWQWGRKKKYQMIFRVPHNTYKMQVFFEESR